jgi:hypothetical protein
MPKMSLLWLVALLSSQSIAVAPAQLDLQSKSDLVAFLRKNFPQDQGIIVGSCRETNSELGFTSVYLILPRVTTEGFVAEMREVGNEIRWINMASINIEKGNVAITDMTTGGDATAKIIEEAAKFMLENRLDIDFSYELALSRKPSTICPS